MERISRLLLGLEALPASLPLAWGHYYGTYGLSEHKHCDNTATNSNSEEARSRMMVYLRGRVCMGTKENQSSSLSVCIAGFHHFTARPQLSRFLKIMNRLFF
jgi:hypothetical protein